MEAVVQQDYRVIAALNAEWEELVARHREDVRGWAARHAVLAHCEDLDDVLVSIWSDADAVLYALLTRSGSGDHLAARVVLQAMLGKVVVLARRDTQANEQDYVVAMWCRIATYPLADRPVRIAANLAMDALKTVHGERVTGPPGVTMTLLPPERLVDWLHHAALGSQTSAATTLTATGVIETAEQLGLLDIATRDVLLSVYAEGLSGVAAAGRHRTTPGMVRYRCSRAVRRLAAHSAALAAA